jgi:hypothetical protein
MKIFGTSLKVEFHPAKKFSRLPETVFLLMNQNGLFVDNRKVTDIYFNGIQLRLYISGKFKDLNLALEEESFYMVSRKNENTADLSFEELHSKLKEALS